MDRRLVVVPVGVAALVAAAYLSLRPGDPAVAAEPQRALAPEGGATQSVSDARTEPEPGSEVASESANAPSPDPAPLSPEEEFEKQLAMARELLVVIPADQWEGEVERLCFGAEFLHPGWDRLTATQKAELERIQAEYRSKMRPIAEHTLVQIQDEMKAKWDRGERKIWRVGEDRPEQESQGTSFAAFRRVGTATAGDRSVSFHFDSAEYPKLEAQLAEIGALRAECVEAKAAYLRSIR
jgi:hypothetical protein